MNVAIIPARGGSKRIPKKNIKNFFGKPMIAYSIESARDSGLFSDIVVSTDSQEIARVAKRYGAKVPFMRPKELSDDFIGTSAVIKHALEFLENSGKSYEFCCTIYATAPFLQAETLKESFKKLQSSGAKYCFSAANFSYPIWRSFSIDENERCKMFFPEHLSSRSQDLIEAYHDAGQFYWDNLSKTSTKPMFDKDSIPFILPRYMVQDIDTQEDWDMAELMLKALVRQNGYRVI